MRSIFARLINAMVTPVTAAIDSLVAWLMVPRNQLGMRYMRISVGWILVYIYAINYGQRHFLMGPGGLWQNDRSFNLYAYGGTVGFETLYHLGIIAALCFALGIGGRLITVVNLLLFWSWTGANFLVNDGGDNILRIMLFYMVFADLHRAIKPDETSVLRQALAVVHNFALIAMALQMSILYLTAGMMKIQGTMWQDGTALYYILQVREFSYPPVANLMRQSIPMLVLGAYSTVFYQIALPWLLLHNEMKRYAIAVAAFFHIGILLAMNLVTFSLIMIALELCFLSNSDFEKLESKISNTWLHRLCLAVRGRTSLLRRLRLT